MNKERIPKTSLLVRLHATNDLATETVSSRISTGSSEKTSRGEMEGQEKGREGKQVPDFSLRRQPSRDVFISIHPGG